MDKSRQYSTEDGSFGRDVLYALRYYLGGRRGYLILAAVLIAGGLAFNWSWLAAAGIAPLLLTALPCVAMCALGLCMNKVTGGSCKSNQAGNPAAADGESSLPGGAQNDLLSDETAQHAQSVSVAVSPRHSLSLTKQKRKTTND
ncbi:MAG: hypothetical protein KUA43_21470 [Hoeflea sp.]|jgi:hypothetical protein|uniref:hypothetical protein n=1 Tax=unclassified Hoeflea TaxID=2614931 RepID=UPI0012564051|nr:MULTISPECIES: hypothetical protein [unclassified Hoeflea]MBU4527515.1 hypothetical protein [Alphaproteobacteria bacterium]MBU4543959.1 hypothetical protein [Alphaproteobacteria bacterium]MBU4552379.1 hypothetical protein [Alphaproteobacteria bacterium]MBV1726018.1 hypothetical protein [Hoeflea sp.]MBV1782376.1 hypothetical protein [Hoeflea sp.]|tara:strand:+ start:36560 stop:36991 length:432 start_codon:yes stop_codon:yes gene_type:complete